jgi:TRAP-type C4-dicarboxylate transport system substrate-binding protein
MLMMQFARKVARYALTVPSVAKFAVWLGAAVTALLIPLATSAEPIELKLSFFGSEQTEIYRGGIKPFVDAVNAEGKGLVAIKVFPRGSLGKALAQQPQLVLDGKIDIAWVVPGQTPYRFPDNHLLELPGLFNDTREGTLVYTHLISVHALRGYQDFFVIGAYMPDPTIIFSRKPVGSLADLRGQKIRANNPVEAETLERFGAMPTVMPAPKLAAAVKAGTIDGAALGPTAALEFGVASEAKHQYLLRGGAAPLLLVMNRRKFEALPEAAQAVIRKYSGEWAAKRWTEAFGAKEIKSLDQLRSDPERSVVVPSAPDLATARRIYRSMRASWAAKDDRNRRLLKMLEMEIAAIRTER